MFCFSVTFAQNEKQKNVVFQNFTMIAESSDSIYTPVLYDLILNNIIKLDKFNVVNRKPEVWKTIEKELAIQDFIAPQTAIQLGNMLGANYYLEGICSHFSSERRIKSTTNNTIDYTFTCTINASLKLVDLETGKYEEAIITTVTLNNDLRNIVIQNAMQATADDLVKKLSKLFLIRGQVKKIIPPDQIIFDKGFADGVRDQAPFRILSNDGSQTVGTLKVVSVSKYEATGRIIEGDFKALSATNQIIESAQTLDNVVTIESKRKDKVVINAGSNIGIKKGDVFVSIQTEEISIGEHKSLEDIVVGKIYVTKVKNDFSEAKIIEGSQNIKPGIIVKEAKSSKVPYGFIQFNYKTSLGVTIKSNKPKGVVTVNNGGTSQDVNTGYLSDYKDINIVNVYSLGLGWKNPVHNLTTIISGDFYKIGSLQNWILALDWNIERPIVPEKFYFTISPGIGYGGFKQKLPNDLVSVLSAGESSELRASSIYLSGGIGLAYEISRLKFHAGISYNYLNYNKWKYDAKVNSSKEEFTAPSSIIPYSSVNLSGLYYNISIAYKF